MNNKVEMFVITSGKIKSLKKYDMFEDEGCLGVFPTEEMAREIIYNLYPGTYNVLRAEMDTFDLIFCFDAMMHQMTNQPDVLVKEIVGTYVVTTSVSKTGDVEKVKFGVKKEKS